VLEFASEQRNDLLAQYVAPPLEARRAPQAESLARAGDLIFFSPDA
jgi:hypothetical protein